MTNMNMYKGKKANIAREWAKVQQSYFPGNQFGPKPISPFQNPNPINFPQAFPTQQQDISAEQMLINDIERFFNSKQISEELYNKLMQALIEEADNG